MDIGKIDFKKLSINNYGRSLLNKTSFHNWYSDIKDVVKTPKSNYWVLDLSVIKEFNMVSFGDCEKFSESVEEKFDVLLYEMDSWINSNIKYPVFVKNGLFSGKHHYEKCCVANNKEELLKRFLNINYFAELSGVEQSNIFVIREMLDIPKNFKAFEDMPVVKEIRFFSKDKEIESWQEYWVEESIKGHTDNKNWEKDIKEINSFDQKTLEYLKAETKKVIDCLDGDWSIDWLQDKNGNWYCIDLAEYHKSYMKENRNFLIDKN